MKPSSVFHPETWERVTRLTTARTWGSHHLPPYSILCSSPQRLHLNGYFSRDSRVGVPKSRQMRLPRLWSAITLWADLVSQPHFGQVWGWSPTLGKVGGWESSGTPECSELDSKGQNTSYWGGSGVIGKVLKRRYRKCPRIDDSDICSPSYGQKKGRESNWQFDSRPLKVRNRPLPNIRFECATWRWKDLNEGCNFSLDLVAIQLCSWELWWFKVPGVSPGQFRDSISGVPGICAIRM